MRCEKKDLMLYAVTDQKRLKGMIWKLLWNGERHICQERLTQCLIWEGEVGRWIMDLNCRGNFISNRDETLIS